MQQQDPPRYDQREALQQGTLFPGLDLPFHKELRSRFPAANSALSELMALRKPALLIPYHSGRGDQVLNAQSLKERGLAHVMLQADLNAESLPPAIDALWEDRALLTQRLSALPDADGTRLVLDQIHKYQKK